MADNKDLFRRFYICCDHRGWFDKFNSTPETEHMDQQKLLIRKRLTSRLYYLLKQDGRSAAERFIEEFETATNEWLASNPSQRRVYNPMPKTANGSIDFNSLLPQ